MLLAKYYLNSQKLIHLEPEVNEFKKKLNFLIKLMLFYKYIVFFFCNMSDIK